MLHKLHGGAPLAHQLAEAFAIDGMGDAALTSCIMCDMWYVICDVFIRIIQRAPSGWTHPRLISAWRCTLLLGALMWWLLYLVAGPTRGSQVFIC